MPGNTFRGIVECAEAMPGDTVQKHDAQIEGFSILPIQVCEEKALVLKLMLSVFLEMCVIVTSERIVSVNMAEPFC